MAAWMEEYQDVKERQIMRKNTFEARYEGHCRQCGNDIYTGDRIGYINYEVLCEDCVREVLL